MCLTHNEDYVLWPTSEEGVFESYTASYRFRSKKTGGQVDKTTIYFFAQTIKEGAIDELPAGYVVSENPRTGLPLLKKG